MPIFEGCCNPIKKMKDPILGLPKEHEKRAVYVVKGSIEFSGSKYSSGQMLVFKKNTEPTVQALEQTTLMLLGGKPLGERFIWWNSVSSRKERIEQAKSFCHPTITKNLFPYRKIVRARQQFQRLNPFRDCNHLEQNDHLAEKLKSYSSP